MYVLSKLMGSKKEYKIGYGEIITNKNAWSHIGIHRVYHPILNLVSVQSSLYLIIY